MNEVVFVAPLGILVVVGLLYLRRVSELGAATCWGLAWLALYGAGLVTAWVAAPVAILPLANVLSGLFSGFQLSGALVYRRRGRVPRWPVLAGLGSGALSGALGTVGSATAAWSVHYLEVGLLAAAAGVMWRAAGGRSGIAPERVVAVGLALVVGLDLLEPSLRQLGLATLPLLVVWGTLSLGLGLAQILVFVEQSREREARVRREGDLLRGVIRAAATQQEVPGLIQAAVEGLRKRGGLDLHGVWLLSEDGRFLESAARATDLPHLLGPIQRMPADLPLCQEALNALEPVIVDDLKTDARVVNDWVRHSGLRGMALVPLRWRGRTLGLLAAGIRRPGAFLQEEKRFLAALGDEIALAIVHVRSVAERDEQARALAAEERTLRALLESVPAGILLIDRERCVRMQNRMGAEQWGLGPPEKLVGRPAREIRELAAARLEDARELLDRTRHRDPAQRQLPIAGFEVRVEGHTLLVSSHPVLDEDGDAIGELWMSRDVTEERHRDERLRQTQRMETLGTLAGGVAHDFNNQLTAILGNARLVLEGLDPDDPKRLPLADLEQAAEHCAELTRGLLTFARRNPSEPRAVDVEKSLREVETVLRPTLEPRVRLEIRLGPRPWPVLADPSQLRRALINLAVNARDALRGTGTIVLEAENAPAATSGEGRVALTVRDDGAGMDARTREHLFDPFFTTKAVGEGTGLGLAIVYGVVEAHGASIEVESEPGRGTAVRLLWPAAQGKVAPQASKLPVHVPSGSGEKILLAEDEPSVRRLARRTLERYGYRVVEAGDGEAAVETLARHPNEVALALLDLSMPRRDGLDAIASLRHLRPGLPVVLMSARLDPRRVRSPRGVRLLAKPFQPDALARAVREALDAAGAAASATRPRGRARRSGASGPPAGD